MVKKPVKVPDRPVSMSEAIRALRNHAGPAVPLPTADTFELILWENVAYLAPTARRREAFEQLRRSVGTTPGEILAASDAALEAVTSRGILKQTFATKLRECARIATQKFGGDISRAIKGPIGAAKKALRSFPGIGEPGAEKILLFSGLHPYLAPDSNVIRVLVRLGLVQQDKSYARMYGASREAANRLRADTEKMQEAHLLLQRHGQTLCRRTKPRCVDCPLRRLCPYARHQMRA